MGLKGGVAILGDMGDSLQEDIYFSENGEDSNIIRGQANEKAREKLKKMRRI